MNLLIECLPIYNPKINELNNNARDLDLPELRREYPNGFTCCGKNYNLEKYSQFRCSHIKTIKHKVNVIDAATNEYKINLGDCDTIQEAFQKKCKENRILKKLNSEKQTELDNEKNSKERLLKCNLELQEENKELKKKIKPIKLKIIEGNLIDL